MKRLLLIVAMGALFLPALQSMRAQDVSIDFFYDNLNGGNWYEVGDYGYVWQPDVASGANWRPYTDGYWAYTDVGWTWVSYEDFGWATYHYGRWTRLEDRGWVWVPGYEWGPAWVSWRTGGDYVGWAPLPPAGPRGEIEYESRPITGHVDVEFGIGPAYYNFVDLRYIGEPVLRDRIVGYDRNVTIINNTVNVTNITYNNSVVYNYGPDFAVVSRYSVRPIQRLTIERQNVSPLVAVKGGNISKVQGNKLLLAAPLKLQKSSTQIAPPKVKAKIEQPKFEKGWSDVSNPGEKAKLEEKFKTENAREIPKPNIQPNPNAGANAEALTNPNAGAAVNAGASPAAANSPAATPAEGKGKGKRNREKLQNEPNATGSPAASATAPEQNRGRKNKGQKAANGETGQATPANSPTENTDQDKGKKNKARGERGEQGPGNAATPSQENQNVSSQNENATGRGKHKGNKSENSPRSATSPENQSSSLENENAAGRGKHKGNKNDNVSANATPQGESVPKHAREKTNAPPEMNNPNRGAGKNREQLRQQVPSQGGPQRGERGDQGKEKGKKNKGENTPPPQ